MKDLLKETKRKMREIESIVTESFCSMPLFLENVVSSSGGVKKFSDMLKQAETREDFENIVNQYI